jgi:hypothetical protein
MMILTTLESLRVKKYISSENNMNNQERNFNHPDDNGKDSEKRCDKTKHPENNRGTNTVIDHHELEDGKIVGIYYIAEISIDGIKQN